MGVFDHEAFQGHEQVVLCRRDDVGLTAIIAIHDTTLGPAIGGCRVAPYSNEDDALGDALGLSRAMTYKAACAGINLGGGNAILIANPVTDKTEAMLRGFGQCVESLNGRFVASTDMGTTPADMDVINQETDHVCGVGQHYGGSGDPSPVCAWGVFYGIKAAVTKVMGDEGLAGRRIAIQGCGSTGYQLARYLHDEGADLVVADIDARAAERVRHEFGAAVVDPAAIFSQPADVFAPCAVGGTLGAATIEQLAANVVCGSANNPLEDEARDAEALHVRGVLYAPDFVVNAGGLISVYSEIHAAPREKAMRDTENIGVTLARVIELAQGERINMLTAAYRVAEERIQQVKPLASFHLGPLE
ncbi:MAG: Glu/Leu/Phe/Val dehydrogenase dimerization domain-containing protein [Myxococcota bacterium]|jgi:leucine dehydrogenase|nr:Glu/Leu/Phe/Val dehydrogenase dimerization domain-containing protein [Myxococcota bacterium]